MIQISLRDALVRAQEIERSLAEMFQRAAESSKLPGAGELFSKIAREQLDHQARLQSMEQSIGDEGKGMVDFDEAFEKDVISPWPFPTAHNIHVFGLQSEAAAVAFYGAMAASTSSDAAKAVFQALGKAEQGHDALVHSWFDGIDESIPKRQT